MHHHYLVRTTSTRRIQSKASSLTFTLSDDPLEQKGTAQCSLFLGGRRCRQAFGWLGVARADDQETRRKARRAAGDRTVLVERAWTRQTRQSDNHQRRGSRQNKQAGRQASGERCRQLDCIPAASTQSSSSLASSLAAGFIIRYPVPRHQSRRQAEEAETEERQHCGATAGRQGTYLTQPASRSCTCRAHLQGRKRVGSQQVK